MAPQRPDVTHLLRSLAGPATAALLTLLVQLPFFRLWFAFMDEGHMVLFADLVVRGGEFYRDATFYPLPGAFWLLAAVFEVFGSSLLVSRWLVVLEFALFVGIAFALVRRMTDTRFAILAVAGLWLYRIWAFPHWQIYSYSSTSLLVLLASLSTLLVWLRSRDTRVLLAAGFLYGLGVLCKQDYGAAALLAVLAVLAVDARGVPRDRRPGLPATLAGFLGPAALVGAATGAYFWQAGILGDLIRFTVTNHFVGMGSYEYTEFPALFPLFGQDAALRTQIPLAVYMPAIAFTADSQAILAHPLFTGTPLYDWIIKLVFYGPPVCVAFAAARMVVVRRRLLGAAGDEARLRGLDELALVVFGAALVGLVWLNKPQDYVHLAVLCWPLVGLAVVHAHALYTVRPRAFAVVVVLALVPGVPLVAYSVHLVHALAASHTDLVGGERGGVYVKPAEARLLEDLVAYVKENTEPDDRVAAIPYFPIVNFLAERAGPHRSAYIVWPFPEVPDRDEQVVAAFEATGTDLVVYNFTQFHGFDPVWEHAPVLFDYLVDGFEIDRVFSYDAWGYKLAGLKRRPETARPGVRILPEGARGLALHVEDAGPPRPVPPDSRDAYVQETSWPFRPVVALRGSVRGQTVLTIPLEVPAAGARLRTAVAVHPQWWFKLPPSWVEFTLSVSRAGRREVLFRQRLDPTMVIEDRGWFEVDVSLDAFAGQRVAVELINEVQRPTGAKVWTGGWAIPRLVVPGETHAAANGS